MKRVTKRLAVQALESRQLMAGDIAMFDGTIAITGTDQHDAAEVYSENGAVVVNLSSFDDSGLATSEQSASFAADQVNEIVFQGGDGDDLLVNDTSVRVVARAGAGDDVLLGGGGDDILLGGTGNDLILGGGGNDQVFAGPGVNTAISLAPTPDDSPADTETQSADESNSESSTETNDSVENEQVDEANDVQQADAPTAEAPVEDDAVGDEETATPIAVIAEPVPEEIEFSEPCMAEPEPLPVGEEATPVAELDQPVDLEASAEGDVVTVDAEAEVTTEEAEPVPTDSTPNQQAPIAQPEAANEDAESDEPSIDVVAETAEGEGESDDAEPQQVLSNADIIFGGLGSDLLYGDDGDDMIFGDMSPLDDELMRGVIAGRFGF